MPRILLFTGCVNQPLSYARSASGKGIASFFVDEQTGAVESGPIHTGIVNPTFVALSPDGTKLAAITETEHRPEDEIVLFAVDRATGTLTLLGRQSTGGDVACHCAFDATGQAVAAANYSAGNPGRGFAVSIHRLDAGRPGPSLSAIIHPGSGPNLQRQTRSHAHCVRWTPDNRYIAVVDLGLDNVRLYRADNFTLASETTLPPGSGPRHIAFHPSKPLAYVMAELEPAVSSFAYADGRLELLMTEPVQPPVSGGSGIVVAPTGTHLFVGDRGNKAVVRFDIDPLSGIASFARATPCGGDVPRDLAFSPSGTILAVANVMSDAVVLFRHAPGGALTPLATVATGTPTAVAFL